MIAVLSCLYLKCGCCVVAPMADTDIATTIAPRKTLRTATIEYDDHAFILRSSKVKRLTVLCNVSTVIKSCQEVLVDAYFVDRRRRITIGRKHYDPQARAPDRRHDLMLAVPLVVTASFDHIFPAIRRFALNVVVANALRIAIEG